MSDSNTYFDEYADAAGLRRTDMPNTHHPLLENDDEVKDLADLVDVREEVSPTSAAVRELERGVYGQIDIQDALTFPHANAGAGIANLPDTTDFDGDARTHAAADDADDTSYMTRADVASAMNATDPDPNAGMDADEFIGDDVEGYRAPDITGTVTGIARGMATHLPQDIGAQGFQIEDPEEDGDPSLDPEAAARIDARRGHTDPSRLDPADSTPGRDNLNDGDRIPTRTPKIDTRDDALDATRQER